MNEDTSYPDGSDQIIVSFCIPVYNNPEAAVKIVNALLSSPDKCFEVVVSDDASTDNVQELLAEIHDDRFKYYRNDKNLGTHKNWLKSLELGRGEWLYLVMGRDMMSQESIGKLLMLLEQASKNDVAYIKDEGHYRSKMRIYAGIDAMMNLIGYNHQTGEIFRREYFMTIPERGHYFSNSDMYPENYVIRDMMLKAKGAFIHSGVNIGQTTVSDLAKVVSKVEYAVDIQKVYFAPPRRIKQFYEQIDMVDELPEGTFSYKELSRYFKKRYLDVMNRVSYAFLALCRDPVNMAHYGQPLIYISIPGMVRNIISAYHEIKAYLKKEGRCTPKRQLIMKYCTARTIVFMSAKTVIQRVLDTLGIWKFLYYLRHY